MKHFDFFLSAVVALILLVTTIAFVDSKNEFPDKHLEIVLRNIGHQLLLHSKDSTSRVLPVKTINKNTYQISFENSFGFTPDTLMQLVHQQLTKTNMPQDYIVSVIECQENKTIFAFEINTFDGDLKPCGGREQQTGCYLIQIDFLVEKSFNYAWLLTAIGPLTFIGLIFNRRKKKQQQEETMDEESTSDNDKTEVSDLDYKSLGKFRFGEEKGVLCLNDETIELSENETKALSIFASNQNLVVERERLRQEIWDAKGVFVINRNVDVLVSKLRKKLSGDPSIKIVNVHNKGYKFIKE